MHQGLIHKKTKPRLLGLQLTPGRRNSLMSHSSLVFELVYP